VAVSAAFRDHLLDLFASLGDIEVKPMFGGAGIYCKDQIFALVIAERIYLKTDEVTRPAFEREGAQPFRYRTKNGEIGVMAYWELPERLLDDPDELKSWAKNAYETGIRSRGKKAAATKKARAGRPLNACDLPLLSPRRKRRN
jgi:DNA transformation protein